MQNLETHKSGFGFVRENQGVQIQKHSSRRLNKGSLIAIARTGMSTSAIVPDLTSIGCLRFPFP